VEKEIDQLTLTVSETAKLLGISRNTAYEACHDGTIPTIRIGKRFLVSKVVLERMINKV
jgi:excisionase family DNA binding protein